MKNNFAALHYKKTDKLDATSTTDAQSILIKCYDELLKSIRSITFRIFSLWKEQGLSAVFQHINASFLLTLGLGILTSIFSLAKLVTHLLETQAVLLWSFFFGLVLASTLFILKKIPNWNFQSIISVVTGAGLATVLLWLEPAQNYVCRPRLPGAWLGPQLQIQV